MRLVPASLQPYVSKTIKFFQIHEEDAALHTFLLYLDTLTTNTVYHINLCITNTGTNWFATQNFARITNNIFQVFFLMFL